MFEWETWSTSDVHGKEKYDPGCQIGAFNEISEFIENLTWKKKLEPQNMNFQI